MNTPDYDAVRKDNPDLVNTFVKDYKKELSGINFSQFVNPLVIEERFSNLYWFYPSGETDLKVVWKIYRLLHVLHKNEEQQLRGHYSDLISDKQYIEPEQVGFDFRSEEILEKLGNMCTYLTTSALLNIAQSMESDAAAHCEAMKAAAERAEQGHLDMIDAVIGTIGLINQSQGFVSQNVSVDQWICNPVNEAGESIAGNTSYEVDQAVRLSSPAAVIVAKAPDGAIFTVRICNWNPESGARSDILLKVDRRGFCETKPLTNFQGAYNRLLSASVSRQNEYIELSQ